MSLGVTVALPVHHDPGTLAEAFGCVARQAAVELEVLLVLNGADERTTREATQLAASEPRARVITLPEANLARALNAALREARHPLVARMDADDRCAPDRLSRQAAWMDRHPQVAALGTGFYRLAPHGETIETVMPPCDPAEIRWRLCLENVFCHGSMMLRRDAVLEAGGYDGSCTRAQDYDLWLRLSARAPLANLPELLYAHRVRDAAAPSRNRPDQARHAAEAMLDRWATLPAVAGDDREGLTTALASVLAGGAAVGAGFDEIERLLNAAGPTREGLLAWLLASWRANSAAQPQVNACRVSRLKDITTRIRRAGASRVWLWGAGRHTAWVVEHASEIGLPIAGLVDDAPPKEHRYGFFVQPPEAVPPGDHVLLSSDRFEDAMWRRSTPHRARGVRVWRLYAEEAA